MALNITQRSSGDDRGGAILGLDRNAYFASVNVPAIFLRRCVVHSKKHHFVLSFACACGLLMLPSSAAGQVVYSDITGFCMADPQCVPSGGSYAKKLPPHDVELDAPRLHFGLGAAWVSGIPENTRNVRSQFGFVPVRLPAATSGMMGDIGAGIGVLILHRVEWSIDFVYHTSLRVGETTWSERGSSFDDRVVYSLEGLSVDLSCALRTLDQLYVTLGQRTQWLSIKGGYLEYQPPSSTSLGDTGSYDFHERVSSVFAHIQPLFGLEYRLQAVEDIFSFSFGATYAPPIFGGTAPRVHELEFVLLWHIHSWGG